MKNKCTLLSLLLLVFVGFNAVGQEGKTFTEADYDRAVAMLNASKLVDNDIRPEWLPDDRLWYTSETEGRVEYKLFNPETREQILAETQKELFEKGLVSEEASRGSRLEVASPDGKYVAFIRDWNLMDQRNNYEYRKSTHH